MMFRVVSLASLNGLPSDKCNDMIMAVVVCIDHPRSSSSRPIVGDSSGGYDKDSNDDTHVGVDCYYTASHVHTQALN